MAASSSQVFKQIAPNAEVKVVAFEATSAANGDTITVSPITVLQGCLGFSTTGVPMTYTITGTTNVITVKNGGALVWKGIAWGI